MDDLISIFWVVLALLGVIAHTIRKNKAVQSGEQAPPRGTVQKVKSHTQPKGKQAPAAAPQAPQEALPPVNDRRMQPTISVTPHTEDIFEGSMHAETGEGYDPCHEDDLQPQTPPCEASPLAVGEAPAPAPTRVLPQWSGDELVHAFVMSEVLTRPCNRRGIR